MTTASTDSTERGQGYADEEHHDIPQPLAGPNAQKASDRPSTWDLMRGQHSVDELHPYWIHTVTASGVTLLAGILLSLMHLAWWGWILAFILLVLSGGTLGSALTHRASSLLNKLGHAAGGAWGVAIGTLGLVMDSVDFYGHAFTASSRVAWLTWVALALFGSIVHRWLWGRLVEISDPTHPRGVEYRRKRNGGIWETACSDGGLGNVTIESVAENWCGVEVIFRADPQKMTTEHQVKSAADKVVIRAHQLLREEGEEEGLGIGEVEARKHGGQRDLFILKIRTRDPLTEALIPALPSADEFVVGEDVLMHLGLWETGRPMEVPEQGPHKFACGTTGSGKSTWLRALQAGYARRPHWSMWAAGTAKLFDLIGPAVHAAREVDGDPIFEMWGGGDGGVDQAAQRGQVGSAQRVVAAAYMLCLSRAARMEKRRREGQSPQGFIGTRRAPKVALFLDEFDDLVRNSPNPITLPNGDKKTVWDLLVYLGSKARAYGIELVLATQRTTDSWLASTGAAQRRSMNDVLTMCNTRYIFKTSSSSGIRDMLKNGNAVAKAQKLEEMDFACMATIGGIKSEDSYAYGKTELWDDDDILEITRLANELGTITTLSNEEIADLGGLYVRGEQPAVATSSGWGAAGSTSTKVDSSKWGDDSNRAAERRRIADELLRSSGGPSTHVQRQDNAADQDATEDTPADPFADTLAQIANLETLTQAEVDAMREQYGDRYPDTPEEMLGAILDAWDELDDRPAELTAGDMVRRFGLHWMDTRADERANESDVITAAATLLGTLLRGEPISVEPRRSNRGRAYARDALREAYARIMES